VRNTLSLFAISNLLLLDSQFFYRVLVLDLQLSDTTTISGVRFRIVTAELCCRL
jgi:hypothetical protein